MVAPGKESVLRCGEAGGMAVYTEGRGGGPAATARVTCLLGGALSQLQACLPPFGPAERRQLLAQGHCSRRIPLCSHLGCYGGTVLHPCLQGQAPAGGRLLPLVLEAPEESCPAWGGDASCWQQPWPFLRQSRRGALRPSLGQPRAGLSSSLRPDCSRCHALRNCWFVVLKFSNAGALSVFPKHLYINVQNKDVLLRLPAELYKGQRRSRALVLLPGCWVTPC